MELSKEDKRQLQSIIRKGILRRCEEWLKETASLINKEYDGDENAFDRCMEITKRSHNYYKEAMRREDYYRNSSLSHLSEMLTPIAPVSHHTALRLCGVNCTTCVTPLRGDEPHQAPALKLRNMHIILSTYHKIKKKLYFCSRN